MYGSATGVAFYSSSALEALQGHKPIEMIILLGFFWPMVLHSKLTHCTFHCVYCGQVRLAT